MATPATYAQQLAAKEREVAARHPDATASSVAATAKADLKRIAAAKAATQGKVVKPTTTPTVAATPAPAGGILYPVTETGVQPTGHANLTPLSLSQAQALINQGRSSDTNVYTQQLFALQAYPQLAVPLEGQWPSEATNAQWREMSLTQLVASTVGAGPAYNPTTSLTNAQVVAAYDWNAQLGSGLALNPTYAKSLASAYGLAKGGKPTTQIAWGTSTGVGLVSEGTYGQTPVSGFYGNATGAAPVAQTAGAIGALQPTLVTPPPEVSLVTSSVVGTGSVGGTPPPDTSGGGGGAGSPGASGGGMPDTSGGSSGSVPQQGTVIGGLSMSTTELLLLAVLGGVFIVKGKLGRKLVKGAAKK